MIYLKVAFLSVVFLLIAGKAYLRSNGDFREGTIRHEMSFRPEWEIEPLHPDQQVLLDTILNQHFTYLNKGAQCYVFSSEDDRWVLKIFKFKHLRPAPWIARLPSWGPVKEYKEKKNQRLERVFDAHKLAYDRLRDDSGFLYIHLNPSSAYEQKVSLTDKRGKQITLDLNGLVFVVQEKSIPFKQVLDKLLSNGDIPGAKESIQKVIALYRRQHEAGIYDWGRGIMHNNGFIGDRAIHFDVEKFVDDESVALPAIAESHLDRIRVKLKDWIEENYPQYLSDLKSEIRAS